MATGGRALSALLSGSCLAGAGWLLIHHPVAPAVLAAACAGLGALAMLRFVQWPLWLLPLLPVSGLAPWTGWLVAEEWDLLVLAVAGGGYLHLALEPKDRLPKIARSHDPPSHLPAPWLFMLAYAALTLQAAMQGVHDAGGLWWGWWQGYHEPLNAVRLAKPVIAVLLLLPLWHACCRRDPLGASRTLLLAMVMLAVVAAVPVWMERAAFVGLTNMSSDYRATGTFWEMHVGGAALDSVLALAAPFVLFALLAARTAGGVVAAAVAAGLVLYAALATFSRIVYVAVPVGLLVCGLLRLRQGQGQGLGAAAWALLLLALLAGAAWWLFPVAGYRGVGALLGCFALLLPLATAGVTPKQAWPGVCVGLAAALAVWGASIALAKGAYLAFAAAWVLGGLALAGGRRLGRVGLVLALGGFIGSVAGMVAVAGHWGGIEAARKASAIAAGLLGIALLAALARRWRWPSTVRWQASVTVAAVGLVAMLAVFLGGTYMADRVTTVREDGQSRHRHWLVLLDQLSSVERHLFGKGLGRTPIHLANAGVRDLTIGDARLAQAEGQMTLRMLAGPHTQGWGEMLRLSQRIERPARLPLKLLVRVRGETPLTLHAEVCDKHLLYDGACQIGSIELLQPTKGWSLLEISLGNQRLDAGAWYAPRSVVFSLALAQSGARAEIDDMHLLDPLGHDLLRNGSFEDGLARWFLTSDRHHMPWHAKNLAVHLWFEQGLLSLAVLSLGVLALAVRVLGQARHHPLGPPIAGAVVGVAIVGLVDSVFDIPRAAFLSLWLLAVGLSLPYTRPPTTAVGNTT